LNVAIQIGSFIGAGLGLICLKSFLPEWGWRVPFLCGAVFGLFGYYVRKKIQETPDFIKATQNHNLVKLPLWETIKRDKNSIFRTMGICAAVMAPFQMIYVYMGDVLKTKFHLLPDQILIHNMHLMVLMAAVLPIMGYFADKAGYKRIMSLSLLGAIVASYPCFWFIERAVNSHDILIMQSILAVLACGVAAPCCVLVSNLFPIRERYSGYALGWSVGSILFAGLVPLFSLLLVQGIDDPKAPAYILMICGIAGLLAMKL
jgi:MHS family proline/betaine transporter-like MFS transporter